MPSYSVIAANLLVVCLLMQIVSVPPQLCTGNISILLDTVDRSLIAYTGDAHDKEEPTIKNMSGSSYATLRLRRQLITGAAFQSAHAASHVSGW